MLYKHGILNKIWMIDPAFADNYLPLVAAYIQHGPQEIIIDNSERNHEVALAVKNAAGYVISEYGREVSPEGAPDDAIAIIRITGTITKHDQNCGPSGMATKSDILRRCFANDKIKGVVISMDSGGGEGMAMRLMAETISTKNKPVIGFIDDYACSAAYGILASCDLIVANSNQARIGSIGTYITIADYTKYFEKQGINLIDIYASASSDKNSEYKEAIKGNTKPVQAIADKFNDFFLSHVEESRSGALTADKSVWGTGKVFFADEAKKIGLIDEIDSFSNILNSFV